MFADYIGEWSGTNRLNLSWLDDPVKQSDSALTVSYKARRQFVAFDYTWVYEGEPQEGLLLLGADERSDAVQTVWTDSWHSKNTLMLSDGKVLEDGSISVKGYYKVEGHPDWGWRTIISREGDILRLTMYNVSPDGDEELAVETAYQRA